MTDPANLMRWESELLGIIKIFLKYKKNMREYKKYKNIRKYKEIIWENIRKYIISKHISISGDRES